MKTEKIILFITLFCLSNSDLLAQCSLIPPSIKDIPLCNTNPYVLTFEDNFIDTTLDLDNWRLDNQPGSLNGSSSHQIYTLDPDNIEVSNGTLKIIANNIAKTRPAIPYLPYNQILDDGLPNERPYQYSSSSIWSKRFFREGKYEIKCRISKGKGLWPAFWLFDGDSSPGGSHWSELDFFEIYYDKESYFNSFKYTNNIHYDLNNDGKTKDEQCSFAMGGIDFSTWHTFTCYFTSDRIDFYIDNTFIHRKVRYFDVNSYYKLCKSYSYKAQAMEQVAWPRSYMNIVLNMAIETGNPPNSQTFPGVFEIDYVRVWERESIPVNCGDIIVKGSPFTGGYLGEWGLLTQNAAVIVGTGVAITVRDKLYIQPNFKAQHGSYFHAKADPVACGVSARMANEEGDSTSTYERPPNLEKEDEEETIASSNQNSNLLIFPNPTNGLINIELNSNKPYFEIEVFSLLGELVYANKVNGSKLSFDLSPYPKGVYLVKIKQDNHYYHEKISYY